MIFHDFLAQMWKYVFSEAGWLLAIKFNFFRDSLQISLISKDLKS